MYYVVILVLKFPRHPPRDKHHKFLETYRRLRPELARKLRRRVRSVFHCPPLTAPVNRGLMVMLPVCVLPLLVLS